MDCFGVGESKGPKLRYNHFRPHTHVMLEHRSRFARNDTNKSFNRAVLPVCTNATKSMFLAIKLINSTTSVVPTERPFTIHWLEDRPPLYPNDIPNDNTNNRNPSEHEHEQNKQVSDDAYLHCPHYYCQPYLLTF